MAMHSEDLRINPPSPNVMFLAVDQWWFSVSGAAADHHAGRGRHEDHVRCSSVSPGVQQWRGVRQAPAGVQLQSLSGREDLRHPEDLHDGGGDRPQRRAHGGGLIQRLRPADQNTERLAAHQQLQTDARSRSLQPRQEQRPGHHTGAPAQLYFCTPQNISLLISACFLVEISKHSWIKMH